MKTLAYISFILAFSVLVSSCYTTKERTIVASERRNDKSKVLGSTYKYSITRQPTAKSPYVEIEIDEYLNKRYATRQSIDLKQNKNFLGKLPIVVGAGGVVGGAALANDGSVVAGAATIGLSAALMLVNSFMPNTRTKNIKNNTDGYEYDLEKVNAEKGLSFNVKTQDGTKQKKYRTDGAGKFTIDLVNDFSLCGTGEQYDVNFFLFNKDGYKVPLANGKDYFSQNPSNFCGMADQHSGERATITWNSSTKSSSSTYTVDVCINAKAKVARRDVTLLVNDRVINDAPMKGLDLGNDDEDVTNSTCTLNYTRKITLDPGNNKIEIKVANLDVAPTTSAIKVTQERLQRYALVIGNSDYKLEPLKNPVNDANDMYDMLKAKNFDVIRCIDCDKAQMEEAVTGYVNKLKNGGVGLFYYAGHGVQFGETNYLIPVKANINSRAEVVNNAVSLTDVLLKISSAKNNLNVVILDACRNDPFRKQRTRGMKVVSGEESVTKNEPEDEAVGLALPPKLPDDAPGILIAYSTSPGSVASDGSGRNGLYTEKLLEVAKSSNNNRLEDLFKKVRASVKAAKPEQNPWEQTSLTEDFSF